MFFIFIKSCHTGAQDKTAMRNSAVFFLEFFIRDKMNGCIVIRKIIRHCNYIMFNLFRVSTFLQYNKTLSGVFFAGRKNGVFAVFNGLNSLFNRNCILFAVFNALNTSNRIRMTLTYSSAPECVIITFG